MDSSGGGLDHSAESNISSSDNDRLNSSPDNQVKNASGVGSVGKLHYVSNVTNTSSSFNYMQSFRMDSVAVKLCTIALRTTMMSWSLNRVKSWSCLMSAPMMRIGWRASLKVIRRGVACFPLVLYICCQTKWQPCLSEYLCVCVCEAESLFVCAHVYECECVLYKNPDIIYYTFFKNTTTTTTIVCIYFLFTLL